MNRQECTDVYIPVNCDRSSSPPGPGCPCRQETHGLGCYAVVAGMPIPELAATCRGFLVVHEFLRRIHPSREVNSDPSGLQGTEVAAAMQNSSDLKAVRRGTKKYHVHTDRHTAASCNPESRS
jgi:hypothetical protein